MEFDNARAGLLRKFLRGGSCGREGVAAASRPNTSLKYTRSAHGCARHMCVYARSYNTKYKIPVSGINAVQLGVRARLRYLHLSRVLWYETPTNAATIVPLNVESLISTLRSLALREEKSRMTGRRRIGGKASSLLIFRFFLRYFFPHLRK